MRKKGILLTAFLLVAIGLYSQTDELREDTRKAVLQIISAFEKNDAQKISELVKYPLKREYPLPNIANKKDFVQRFNQIFDTGFVEKIKNSKMSDWSEMGWRGIMFGNGELWLDDEGKIIAVNHQSEAEKALLQNLIEKQKNEDYSFLKDLEKPVYLIETKNYRILIDELSNGDYRYSSWKINAPKNSKPDIEIRKGTLEFEGSGGNHTINFKNNIYTYKITVNIIGTSETPDAVLHVFRNNRLIISEEGSIHRSN